DRANKRNQVIADLEKARRNSDGKVEMSADLVILRPRDLSRGNGIALFDIVNRGGTVALTIFDGPVTNTPEGEVGDGFLLNRGYTIVQVGWEFDARREGAIRVDLPEAVGVSGLVRATFIPSNRNPTTVGDLVGYAPSDPGSPQNTLRVRSKLGAEWVTIPRAKWTLAGNTVTLEGGFEPGQNYELAYLAHDPPSAGLGFVAVRDAAAWVRYASHDVASARYTIAFGSSQTGRWLRDFLYEGFNADERNRQGFDGVIPPLGGRGRGQPAGVRRGDGTSGRRRRCRSESTLVDADIVADGNGHALSVLGQEAARSGDGHRGRTSRERPCCRASTQDLLHLFGHRVLGAQRG